MSHHDLARSVSRNNVSTKKRIALLGIPGRSSIAMAATDLEGCADGTDSDDVADCSLAAADVTLDCDGDSKGKVDILDTGPYTPLINNRP